MNLTYVRRTHLVLQVEKAMHPSGLITAQMASMCLHAQYLTSARDMKPGFSTLVSFKLRHLLLPQVPFLIWFADQQAI